MLGRNDHVIPGERNAASSATCSRESAERLAAAWPIAFANHEKACAEGIVSELGCLGCSDVSKPNRSIWLVQLQQVSRISYNPNVVTVAPHLPRVCTVPGWR